MFERIVCGVDGSTASLEAVRQADALLVEPGRLVLVAAVDLSDAIHFQIAPTALHAARRALETAEELDRQAQEALARARSEVVRVEEPVTIAVAGDPARCLVETAATEAARLIAVGSHGLARVEELAIGSVAAWLVRRVPCSVLVARAPAEGLWSPRTLVVGTDGSRAAAAAVTAAEELGARLGATVEISSVERRPSRCTEPCPRRRTSLSAARLRAGAARSRIRRAGSTRRAAGPDRPRPRRLAYDRLEAARSSGPRSRRRRAASSLVRPAGALGVSGRVVVAAGSRAMPDEHAG